MQDIDLKLIDYIILTLAVIVLYMYIMPIIRRKMKGNINFISPAELKKKLSSDDDILIIDVRREAEFNSSIGHINNAINIPIKDIPNKLNEKASSILELIDTNIVIVGFANTSDGYNAYAIFKNHGFTNLLLLDGGITAWVKCKFPVEIDKTGAK